MNNKVFTEKQKLTLMLFARGYPVNKIAKTLGVADSTIRRRIKKLSDTDEFDKALHIRNSHKTMIQGLKNPLSLSEFNLEDMSKETVRHVF